MPAIAWGEYQTCLPSEDEIRTWFTGRALNLAIVTGDVSGVVVVDCDSLPATRWATAHLPHTPWQVQTASGWHFYYQHPGEPVRNRARLATHQGRLPLDVRAAGGYVIAAGSVHETGITYTQGGDWREPREALPVFNSAWLAAPTSAAAPSTPPARVAQDGPAVLRRARRYLAAITPPEGGHGSDSATLYAACRLVRGFALSPADAEELLWGWAGGRQGWTREWVAAKVRHAERYGTEPIGALTS